MAHPFAPNEQRSGWSVRLTTAALAAGVAAVLAVQADSTWHLSTSPWFALSMATVAAALRVELDRS